MDDEQSLEPSAQVRRLKLGDGDLARRLFAIMAEVFNEPSEPLSDDYVDALLRSESFWAIAAFAGDEVLGGLTAHTLPMTRTKAAEVFIYDIAVRESRQRHGIGRQLVTALRALAAEAGIQTMFVAADTADTHALDFYKALGAESAEVVMFTFSD